MTGAALQKAVIQFLHLKGFRVAHFASVPTTRRGKTYYATPVQADGKGWVDLFCVKPGRAMAIEIKGDGDRLREEQKNWLEWLRDAGIEAHVFTAKMWRDGDVFKIVDG